MTNSADSNSDHHPDTNTDEEHLGGYIRGCQSETPTIFGLEHGDPATWCPDLWRWAVEKLKICSVMDVGCGEGHAAGFFRDLGCEVIGVDGSTQAKRDSVIPDQHAIHDFTLGPFNTDEPVDLVWCCEFVEHVEAQFLDNILAAFSCAQNYVMMTAASPGQPGYHHVNCQDNQYWVNCLATIGFDYDFAFTTLTRTLAPETHYGWNGLFFVKPTS